MQKYQEKNTELHENEDKIYQHLRNASKTVFKETCIALNICTLEKKKNI